MISLHSVQLNSTYEPTCNVLANVGGDGRSRTDLAQCARRMKALHNRSATSPYSYKLTVGF